MARPATEAEPTAKPKRRAPGEGRQLILEAAHEVFSTHGYAGATTRQIAERAGIVEALLFRNFGSKAALFNEVVFGPIRAFVLEWEEYETSIGREYVDEHHGRMFVDRFYDLLRANRGLIVSYLATTVFEPEVLERENAPALFRDIISTIDRVSVRRAAAVEGARSAASKDATRELVAERSLVGTVMMAALFEDLLFDVPGMGTPDPRLIKDELTRMAIVTMSASRT